MWQGHDSYIYFPTIIDHVPRRVSEMDYSELSFPSMSGSRLLSESSLGTNQEDLSISELSLEGAEGTERPKRRLAEEKLQSDLQILRNLNATFGHFNEALDATESTNQVRRCRGSQCKSYTTISVSQSSWHRQKNC